MEKSGAKAYLVNTGWNGTGKRISIKDTRGIIDAILNGDILNAPTKTDSVLQLRSSDRASGSRHRQSLIRAIHTQMLPSGMTKAKDLAQRFVKNFAKYESNADWQGTGCSRSA